MDYCKYHPLSAASHACHQCHTHLCELCIDEAETGKKDRCFICELEVESLGAVNTAEPFWRRLEKSFRYPMNKSSLSLIIGVAVLSPIISYLPFAFIFYLALMGSLFKYGFSCLKNSAFGMLSPPDISEAFEGGLGVAGRLILMMFIIIAGVYACHQFFGATLGNLIGIIMIIGVPAMLINFALTEDIFAAINPLNMLNLVITIGLPYGLLLAFIMIMSGSVGVISELIGIRFSFISMILQSIVLNYYLIVIFHIMGYMIFQYQGVLGFSANIDDGEAIKVRDENNKLLANIDVHLKEGHYQKVDQLFQQSIKNNLNSKEIYQAYFDFLYATKNKAQFDLFASSYFDLLKRTNQQQKMATRYKQILQVNPKFVGGSAELRLDLAKACYQAGEPKLAAKLLNGLHKTYPQYERLIEAYELLSECFDDLPNMADQSIKCRGLVEKLKKLSAKQVNPVAMPEPSEKKKAVFSSIDESLSKQVLSDDSQNKEVVEQKENPENVESDDSTSQSIDPRKKDLPPLDFY